MLLNFRVSNFRSIKDEQVFSFLRGSSGPRLSQPLAPSESINQSDLDSKDISEAEPWLDDVGTVAGIFGPNASGKSNVLEALIFMDRAIRDSYRQWGSVGGIPVQPFALESGCSKEPSLFEAVYVSHGMRFQYGFRLTADQVVGEWLYAYPTNRRQVWFERDISAETPYYFGKSFSGRNKVIADLTNRTSLFLSTAIANNHKLAGLAGHWFRSHFSSAMPSDRPVRIRRTQGLSREKDQWNEVAEMVKFADLGIEKVRVRHEKLEGPERERLLRVFKALAEDRPVLSSIESAIDESADIVEFGHSASGQDLVYLPLSLESLGTQAWFSLVGPILRALANGDTLLIDELDASLHPRLTSQILSMFEEPLRNPRQAQLLFTTHDTALMGNLLGERELSRDQIWFTDKGADGATVLYPLTDFSPRKAENLERGYLQGRYGAIPYLDGRIAKEIAERVRDSSNRDDDEDSPHSVARGEIDS
jgi:uncharacterized protein